MKRYFNMIEEHKLVKVEFPSDSPVASMDICGIFGDSPSEIVEIYKSDYTRLFAQYQKDNKSKVVMTIS